MKTKSSFPLSIIVGIMFVVFTTSCSNILKADFETDTIGGKPDAALPGAPLGDALDISSLPTAVRVIDEKIGGSHALEFTNIDYGDPKNHYYKWLTFYAKPGKINRFIDFKWSGKTVNSTIGGDLEISCALSMLPGHGGESISVARVTIDKYGKVTGASYQPVDPKDTFIGDIGTGGEIHKLEISVDTKMDQLTFKLTTPGKSFPLVTLKILTHPEWINKTENKPTLSFTYTQPFNPSRKYILDDVLIEN